jgi:hypothetical protein
MRAGEDLGSLGDEVLNSGHGGPDTGVIGDGLAVEGDVQVATKEDLLSLEVSIRKVTNGELGGIKSERSTGVTSDGGECRPGDTYDKQGEGELATRPRRYVARLMVFKV